MFWHKKEKPKEEYIFDFKKMSFVVENVLEKYLLAGKLKDYDESFMVVCDKDLDGNKLSFNLSLENIGRLVSDQRYGELHDGLRLSFFSNPFDNLLRKSQWFARFNYRGSGNIAIVSEGKTMYSLEMPDKPSVMGNYGHISHRLNSDGLFSGGPFQADKLGPDRVLISDVNSKRLDEIIRSVYKDKLHEEF